MALIRTVTDPKLVLYLLHGYGSDHRDMYGLAQMLHRSVEVHCLPAPIEMMPGRAWFPLGWTEEGIVVDPNEYWESVEKARSMIESHDLPLVVGGFSQGAMVSLGMTQKEPDAFVGILLMSGRGNGEPCGHITGRVFHAHGLYDEVIPISFARTLSQELKVLGDRYEYHEYPMPHSVAEEELDHINDWLDRFVSER